MNRMLTLSRARTLAPSKNLAVEGHLYNGPGLNSYACGHRGGVRGGLRGGFGAGLRGGDRSDVGVDGAA